MSEPRVYNKHRGDAPADAIYVGRGSGWGNPFRIGHDGTRDQVIERYRCEILPALDVSGLIGKSLVCFCAPRACHADLLLEAARAVAETHSRDSSESTPPAVFSDPNPVSGER